MLKDECGRTIDYLRISVIDRCNLRCVYCTPEEGVDLLPREKILSYEDMLAFSKVAVKNGIDKIRLTGGEPLIRRDIIGFVERMARIPGLKDLSMTTNAILLEDLAQHLYDAGMHRLNVGIDTLDPAKFKEITRGGDVKEAIKGIEKAIEVGFSPVKINVVFMKGVSDDITPFVEFIRDHPIHVRFIEYMPVSNGLKAKFFVPISRVREQLKNFEGVKKTEAPKGYGPAVEYYRVGDSAGTIGLIPAMSEHFCGRCSRLRLTADGKLRLCLFSDTEVDIISGLRPEVNEDKLVVLLKEAVKLKPAEYSIVERDDNGRTMSQIGG